MLKLQLKALLRNSENTLSAILKIRNWQNPKTASKTPKLQQRKIHVVYVDFPLLQTPNPKDVKNFRNFLIIASLIFNIIKLS